jgi:hypothetical protein
MLHDRRRPRRSHVPLRPIGRAMMTLIIINPAAPDAGQVV